MSNWEQKKTEHIRFEKVKSHPLVFANIVFVTTYNKKTKKKKKTTTKSRVLRSFLTRRKRGVVWAVSCLSRKRGIGSLRQWFLNAIVRYISELSNKNTTLKQPNNKRKRYYQKWEKF